MALRARDELVVQLRVRFEGGDLGAGEPFEELQRHRADPGADLEDSVPEVRHQLVGDPAEEVVGFGEPLQLDVGSERRSGGSLLVEHPTGATGPGRLVGTHLGPDLLRSPTDHGQAAGEFADVVERDRVHAGVARPERDRNLVDREAVGLGQRDERRVERETRAAVPRRR